MWRPSPVVFFCLGCVDPVGEMTIMWVRREEKTEKSGRYIFDFAFLAWLLSFLDSCILQLGPWMLRIME